MGRLGSGPRLLGRIGSGVRVSVSFQKNTRRVLSYGSKKRGVMTKRGVDLPSSPAYNVEPVTNTSSSSCANNGRRTLRWVHDACRRSSRLYFSHFATRTVDVCSEARYSSRIAFFAYPTCIRRPRQGGSCRNIATLFRVEKLELCGYPMVKKKVIMFIRFDMIHERDKRTDRQTDIAWRHRPLLCVASRGKKGAVFETRCTNEFLVEIT